MIIERTITDPEILGAWRSARDKTLVAMLRKRYPKVEIDLVKVVQNEEKEWYMIDFTRSDIPDKIDTTTVTFYDMMVATNILVNSLGSR
ncbi:hypothetical protein CEW46_21135 [Bacillus cereus]|nr:hypothetical protein CEW46_21135 [Bacillus cereus]